MEIRMRLVWTLASAALALSACSANPPVTSSPIVHCDAPRPQVCTMEYNPVCATLIDGGIREYSSGCNGCADDAVASYLPGRCPSDES